MFHSNIMMLQIVFIAILASTSYSFVPLARSAISCRSRHQACQMIVDPHSLHTLYDATSHVTHHLSTLLAGNTVAATADIAAADPAVCPGFGQPGWAPFCFLNGNPFFKAFDGFQLFIQNSVVSLHDFIRGLGVEEAYGPSIILFTVFVRLVLLPLNVKQIASSQMVTALNPKVQEIREKYPDNKELQAQMTALLYEKAQANPFSGCLPSLVQIPVFLALYRSFYNLAAQEKLSESFLWLPNLEGPVYGARSTDWLTSNWNNLTPSLGWHDTIAFLSIPLLLYVAQSLSLRILTPPSDDPQVQKSQQILKYLPLMLAYFSLSVPAGLGVYWVTNNFLSTATTLGIKSYFKKNPSDVTNIDLDALMTEQAPQLKANYYPDWGYGSEEDMIKEAQLNYRPSRAQIIPSDFQ